MGFFSNVATRIREYWRTDKEQAMIQIAKGTMSPGRPETGYDILQAYGYDVLSDYLRLEHDLLARYVDYEEMDDYPEISAAIDIYSDDASQPDTMQRRSVWLTSDDATIEQLGDDLFHRTLRIDEEIWEIARTVVKYGNDFEEILVSPDGVIGLNFLPPPTVRRIEGPRGELFGFVQDFKGRFGYSPEEFKQVLATRTAMLQGGAFDASQAGYGGFDKVAALEDWEVVHFRLRGKHRRSIYGYSVLEPARWIWKRLMLLEDAALVFRLQRAPERYAYYVDVGDLPPAEALAYVNRIRQQNRKKKFVNPTTGKLDLKFDPMSYDEDFYIPVRKDSAGNRIEVLAAPNWQHMDDIEYFRDKLFASIKIPKAYLGQEEGVARAVLSSEDVRFARTVLRVQRELRNGLGKVFRVHLASLNIDPSKTTWDIHMTTPSAIFELAQLEVRNARADFAGRMKEFVSNYWLLSHVFGMNDEEINTIIKQRKDEVEADAALQAIAGAKANKAAAMYTPNSPEVQAATRLDAGRAAFRTLPPWRTNGISEKELFAGSREAEKRAAGKLDKMLKNDLLLAHRMKELGGLLHDLQDSVHSIRSIRR